MSFIDDIGFGSAVMPDFTSSLQRGGVQQTGGRPNYAIDPSVVAGLKQRPIYGQTENDFGQLLGYDNTLRFNDGGKDYIADFAGPNVRIQPYIDTGGGWFGDHHLGRYNGTPYDVYGPGGSFLGAGSWDGLTGAPGSWAALATMFGGPLLGSALAGMAAGGVGAGAGAAGGTAASGAGAVGGGLEAALAGMDATYAAGGAASGYGSGMGAGFGSFAGSGFSGGGFGGALAAHDAAYGGGAYGGGGGGFGGYAGPGYGSELAGYAGNASGADLSTFYGDSVLQGGGVGGALNPNMLQQFMGLLSNGGLSREALAYFGRPLLQAGLGGGNSGLLGGYGSYASTALQLLAGLEGRRKSKRLGAQLDEIANLPTPQPTPIVNPFEMPNPGDITSVPGYQAGLEAVRRSMASQGYQGSGNMFLAMSKYGGDFYDKYVRQRMDANQQQIALNDQAIRAELENRRMRAAAVAAGAGPTTGGMSSLALLANGLGRFL